MTEQDFSKRLTILVRKDLEGWQVANTIAHISAYVGNKLGETFGTGEFFMSSDAINFPRNSQYPIIIKSADTSASLKEVFDTAQKEGLLYLGFVREMIESTNDEEIESILGNKSSEDIELLGVGIFGENEQIKTLTKKFSLWK